jgi:hypothetical protein
MNRLILIVLLLTAIHIRPVFAQSGRLYLNIKTNHLLHEKYGMKYPVTFGVKLKSDVLNPKVLKWDSRLKKWNHLKESSSLDFYNGIETFRLDAKNNMLYISVAYPDNIDSIAVRITDETEKETEFEFQGFTKYYDNRTAAITASADDWESGNNKSALNACKIFRENHIWLTLGIITNGINDSGWLELQSEFDSGFIEIASHSATHPHIPYQYAAFEIAGSKIKLLSGLSLSGYFANSDREYLYCWIEPYGEADSSLTSALSLNNYLIDRSVQKYFDSLSVWNKDKQLYERLGFSVEMGNDMPSHSNTMLLNDRFDYVFNNHGVYHLNIHPEKVPWDTASYAVQHIKYISNRKDAWYAGLGLLYVYNLTINNSIVSVIRF